MKNEITNKEFTNPIHIIKENVSDFVWKWYEEAFKMETKQYCANGDPAKYDSTYASWTITLKKYRDGIRLKSALARMHIEFKEILLKVFPIENSKIFFIGSNEEMREEALATANRMTDSFKKEHESQMKSLETA